MDNTNKQPYLVFTAIIIAGILIAGAIVWKRNGTDNSLSASRSSAISAEENKGTVAETSTKNPPANVNIAGEGDDPVLGDPNAKLTMVIFGDFQCHFCKKLEPETTPLIVEKYVKTGKLKIIARDFPFLEKES